MDLHTRAHIMCVHNPLLKNQFLIQDLQGKNECLTIAEGLYILEKDTYAISPEKFFVFLNNMFCNTKALEWLDYDHSQQSDQRFCNLLYVYPRDNTCDYSLQIFNCHFSFLEIDAK